MYQDIIRIIYQHISDPNIRSINRLFRDSIEPLFRRSVPASQLREFRKHYPNKKVYRVICDHQLNYTDLIGVSQICIDADAGACDCIGAIAFLRENIRVSSIEDIYVDMKGDNRLLWRKSFINGSEVMGSPSLGLDVSVVVGSWGSYAIVNIRNEDI